MFLSLPPLKTRVGADALPTEDSFENVSLNQVLPPNVPVDSSAWVVYDTPDGESSLTIDVVVGSYNAATDRYLVKTTRDGIASLPLGTIVSLPRTKLGVQPTKTNPLGTSSTSGAGALAGAALGGVVGYALFGPVGLVLVPIGYFVGR